MNENEKKEMDFLREQVEKQKIRNRKNNDIIKNNYDRVSSVLPKGTKDRIKNAGYSVNDFILKAVTEKLEAIENSNDNGGCPF